MPLNKIEFSQACLISVIGFISCFVHRTVQQDVSGVYMSSPSFHSKFIHIYNKCCIYSKLYVVSGFPIIFRNLTQRFRWECWGWRGTRDDYNMIYIKWIIHIDICELPNLKFIIIGENENTMVVVKSQSIHRIVFSLQSKSFIQFNIIHFSNFQTNLISTNQNFQIWSYNNDVELSSRRHTQIILMGELLWWHFDVFEF